MNQERALKKQVASSLAISGVGMVLSRLLNAVALFFILKVFTAAELGTATLVTAIFATLQTLTELGLGAAIVQKRAELSPGQFHAVFWLSAGLACLLAGGVVLSAPFIASFYDNPELAPMLQVYSLTLLAFALYSIPRSKLVYALQFGRITGVEALGGIVSAAVAIALAQQGLGPWALIWGEVAQRVVLLLGFQALSPYLPGLNAKFGEVRDMLRFGLFAMGSRMLSEAYANADYLIVGKLFTANALGIYGFAYRLVADISRTLRGAFVNVSFPTFARLSDDPDALKRYLFGMAQVSILLTGAVLIPLATFLHPVLTHLRYEQWLDAVPYAQVFVVVAIVRAAHVLIPRLLNALGESKVNFYYSAANSLLLPLSFYVGGKWGGLAGVAWAWATAFPLSVVLYVMVAAKHARLSAWQLGKGLFSGVVLLIPGTIACLALAWMVEQQGWLRGQSAAESVALLGLLLLGVAVCLVYPWFSNRDLIRSLLPKMRTK